MLSEKKVIIFDFDGVILDSMKVRDKGFYEIFKEHPIELVEELMKYHRINGGLSRFHKIRYFYENLLKKKITEEEVQKYANKFSVIMLDELTNESLLILDSVNFIKDNYKNHIFYVASGSEEKELNKICEKLGLAEYFSGIYGSPKEKKLIVKDIIESHNYNNKEVALIGDSINDYDAAVYNNIDFYGYNNKKLIDKSKTYIHKF